MNDCESISTFEVPTADGAMPADVYRPGGASAPAVVMCHGFKGHRTWGFIPYLAGRLRDAGLAAVSFDFSFNGTIANGSNPRAIGRYIDRARFRINTISREVGDLRAVVSWIRAGGARGVDASAPLGVWGHSRGGIAALLYALEHPDIAAVASWAATPNPNFYSDRQKEEWHREGAIRFDEVATGEHLAVGVEYLDDLERNRDRYDLARRLSALRPPYLVVHGQLDKVIPIDDARTIFEAARGARARKLVTVNVGHTFGAPPTGEAQEPGPALVGAADQTAEWFRRYVLDKESL